MTKRQKMTKREKQYKELRKRFKITKKEFNEYYDNLRKANRKGQRMKKQGNALFSVKYSYGIKHIKTREDFKRYSKSIKKVLDTEYRHKMNIKYREILRDNLIKLFGYKGGNYINDKLKKMSDKELKKFFDDNDDIQLILYYGDTQIGKFLDYTVNSFEDRIDKYYEKT